MVTIEPVSPGSPAARRLVDELDRYLEGLYPAESNHLDSVEELGRPHVTFLVAREEDEVLGCGAVKIDDGGWGEIKRMYVSPSARGRGIARRILAALEGRARAAGATSLRLETGAEQPEALAFFRREGFAEREAFPPYGPDPLSVFMEKRIEKVE